MLSEDVIGQLAAHVDKIVLPIELVATLDETAKSTEMAQVLGQVAGLSDSISVRSNGTAERSPSFQIRRVGSDISVEFAGMPLGHEFTSFVLALLQVGGHPGNISEESKRAIENLPGDYHFETYLSLTCQNCPDVVQALNLMSVLNPAITHTAIDGGVFPDEVEDRQIMAVPTVFLDGELFDQGRMDIDQIIGKLDDGKEERDAAAINDKDPFDVLVVGGGPAGATAAIYAARKGIRTGLVTERFGGQVLDTLGIENFVSVTYTEGPNFAAAMEEHVRAYDVDIMNTQRVVSLNKVGDMWAVALANGAELSSRTIVLATGARWRELGVPGEAELRNKGVTYCPHCDGPLFKDKAVAVVGGGNSGVEAAIDLAGIAKHVTLMEFLPELKADDVLVKKLQSLPNTEVILSAETTEVLGDEQVVGLAYTDRYTGEHHKLEVDGIFVQIGLLPNTEWLPEGIAKTAHREIVVDAAGRTSLPGVFAAGDCTDTPFKQIVVAAGQGSTAALSAFDHLIRLPVSDA